MSILLAGIMVAMGPLLPHKPIPPEARLFMLKSADAVAVWNALSKYVDDKSLFVAVAPDVRTNSVLVAGDPALVKVLAAMIEKLDNPPAPEDKPDYARMILGKWEVTKGVQETVPEGSTIEFMEDGKLKAAFKIDDTLFPFQSTYTLDGDNLKTKTGEKEGFALTIVKISEMEMSTKDRNGKEVMLKRLN